MSHFSTLSLFPDVSLQRSVPGENGGDGSVGRVKPKNEKGEMGVDSGRVGHCDVRPGG